MHMYSIIFFCLIIVLLVIHKSAYGAPKPKARGGFFWCMQSRQINSAKYLGVRRVPRTSNTFSFPVENRFSNDDDDDGSSDKDTTNTNGLQFMITSKMKNTLINKLGYLPSEVSLSFLYSFFI